MTQKAEVSLRGAQATKQSNLYHNNRLFFIQYSLAMTFYFLKTAITKRVYFYVVLFFVYYTFNFFSHPHKLFIIKCAFKDAELSMNAKPFHHFKQSITAVVIRNIVSNNIKHILQFRVRSSKYMYTILFHIRYIFLLHLL